MQACRTRRARLTAPSRSPARQAARFGVAGRRARAGASLSCCSWSAIRCCGWCSARSACRSRSASSISQRAFTRPQNYAALVNTLQLALGTGIMSVLIGVPLAWATARSDMPLRQVVHALVALSYITPPYLTALAYIILLGPDAGQFNRLLRAVFGFDVGPHQHLQHGAA